MNKRNFISLLLICIIFLTGCSGGGTNIPNTVSVSGQIVFLDSEGETIKEIPAHHDRTIHIKGTDLVTTSKEDGKFVLKNVPTGKQTLEIIYHGYETITVNLDLQKDTPIKDVKIPFNKESGGLSLLYINNERVELELRKAISLALDKDKIIQIVNHTESQNTMSEQAHQFISAISVGYNANIEHIYDVEEAKKIVKDKNFTGRRLEIAVNSNLTRLAIANYIATQLQDIGLNVVVSELEWTAYLEKVTENQDYELTLLGYSYGMAKSPLHCLHYWGVRDPIVKLDPKLKEQLERLVLKSKLEYDQQKFETIVDEFQQLALENYISIPLSQTYSNE